jgi:protein-S-isoprenylcysteine O-methyltransferase Ste14
MYLGAVSILLGEAALLESMSIFVYATFMWLFFHVMVVYGEEPHLRKKYGKSYEEFCKDVPRWIGFGSRVFPSR